MPDSVSAADHKAELDALWEAYQRPAPKNTGQMDKNAFLNILTAQLKYQDPMEGTDNSQFAAQMAQFSALEQMQNLNTSFAAMMTKQDILTGSMWIGKDVMVLGYDNEVTTGKVQGFALDSELGLLLAVNGKEYTLEQVLAVKDPSEEWAIQVETDPDSTPGETDQTENNAGDGTTQTGNQDGNEDGGGS